MSQRTQVLLIDDLDGSSAEETVTFGLDGSAYEIDLSARNADQLRESLAHYVANGRKSALIRSLGRRRGAAVNTSGRAPVRHYSTPDTAAVRAWARSNGHTVNERGRLSAEVVAAYREAH